MRTLGMFYDYYSPFLFPSWCVVVQLYCWTCTATAPYVVQHQTCSCTTTDLWLYNYKKLKNGVLEEIYSITCISITYKISLFLKNSHSHLVFLKISKTQKRKTCILSKTITLPPRLYKSRSVSILHRNILGTPLPFLRNKDAPIYEQYILYYIYISNQFLTMVFPSGVKTLSGWNWMPWMS